MRPSLLGHRVYVDANVFIYAIETPSVFPQIEPNLLIPARQGDLIMVTCWVTLTETLVKPLKVRDGLLESKYRQFLIPALSLRMIEIDQNIADRAADLRARHNLRLADALHIATGLQEHCNYFVTADADWARAGIKVIHPANL